MIINGRDLQPPDGYCQWGADEKIDVEHVFTREKKLTTTERKIITKLLDDWAGADRDVSLAEGNLFRAKESLVLL